MNEERAFCPNRLNVPFFLLANSLKLMWKAYNVLALLQILEHVICGVLQERFGLTYTPMFELNNNKKHSII